MNRESRERSKWSHSTYVLINYMISPDKRWCEKHAERFTHQQTANKISIYSKTATRNKKFFFD